MNPPPDQATKAIGHVLDDRYELVERLGRGGSGEVYRALDRQTDTVVAVKILHPKLSALERIADRFEHEARAAASIDHPAVCRSLDFGRTGEGALYLVMEYVPGRTLQDVLNEVGTLDRGRALLIAEQVCEALEAAHALGVVHRDIKPDNIVLMRPDPEGPEVVKLLDFGIAKTTASEAAPDAGGPPEGIVFGTPEYMSPEQAAGAPVDRRADLYTLGVVIFEMLTGQLPFLSEDPYELMRMHLGVDAPLMSEVTGRFIPRALDTLVWKLLQKERQRRYQSASELRLAISGARETTQSFVRLLPVQPEELPPPPPPRRSPWTWAGYAMLSAAIVTVALVLFTTGDGPSQRPERPRGKSGEVAPAAAKGLAEERARFAEGDAARRAAAALKAGDHEAAIATLEALGEGGGEHASAALGEAYVAAGRWSEGLQAFAAAIAKRPEYAREEGIEAALFDRALRGQPRVREQARGLVEAHLSTQADLTRLAQQALSLGTPSVRADAHQWFVDRGWLDQLEPWAAHSLRLGSRRECHVRKASLIQLAGLGDPRALLILKVVARERTGCGEDQRADCHGCLRKDLEHAIEALERRAAEAALDKL